MLTSGLFFVFENSEFISCFAQILWFLREKNVECFLTSFLLLRKRLRAFSLDIYFNGANLGRDGSDAHRLSRKLPSFYACLTLIIMGRSTRFSEGLMLGFFMREGNKNFEADPTYFIFSSFYD